MTSQFRIFSIAQFLRLGLLAFCAIVVVACGGGAGTVGIPSGTSLFTNAPSAVTLNSGSATYTIGGGTATYKSSSSNSNVITTSVKGTTLNIVSVAAGTAQVTITDAAGASVVITVTVSGSITPTPTTLFTTAPSTLTLAANVSSAFTIAGGKPGYLVSSNNTAVATVAINGNSFIISGVAAGTAQINIFDSAGTSVSVLVTVGSGGVGTALYTTAASSVTVSVAEITSFTIGGGKAPYTASSSNAGVASATVTGTELNIKGNAAGTAQVLVFDASGTSVPITVIVSSSGVTTKLFTTSASSVDIKVGALNTYTIGGGTPPYNVSSSNKAVATASVSDTSLLISGIASGAAQVLVTDSVGASVNIDVTITSSANLVIDVQPNGATGNVGDVLQFLVSGASPAYTITVNNTSIATVSPASVATSGGSFSATLLNAGSTTITIVDSLGQSKSFILTVSQLSTSLRLSPSALIIGEDSTTPIVLNIYGGAGPYRAFTSDQTLSSVSTSGASLTVGLGTNLGRCINPIDSSGVRVPNGTFDVIITVLDSLGASATSTMTIKDNGVGTGATPPGPPPCL